VLADQNANIFMLIELVLLNAPQVDLDRFIVHFFKFVATPNLEEVYLWASTEGMMELRPNRETDQLVVYIIDNVLL
jgi:hypothetical protein